MAKFESPIVVKRKLQVEFGKQQGYQKLMKKKSTKFMISFKMRVRAWVWFYGCKDLFTLTQTHAPTHPP